MIAALLLSYLYMLDPADNSFGAEAVAALKYLPIELAVVALGLYLVTRVPRSSSASATALTALCGLVLAGSLYTILAYNSSLEDSFLGRGLSIVTLSPAVLVFQIPREAKLFVRWVWLPTLFTAALITAQIFVWRSGLRFVDKPHIFHEEIFIVASAMALAYALLRRHFSRWPLTLLFLAGCILTIKNTGFLAALIAGGIILSLAWQRGARDRPIDTVLRRTALLQFLVVLAAFGAFLLIARRELLPSGNPEVRLVTYSQRLGMFIDSPIIGQVFTGSPMVELPGSYSTLVTPSHSDVLDILAFGGIVGFCLFAIPLLQLGRSAIRNLSNCRSTRDWPGVYFLAVLLVFGMEMAVNPVWNQPKLAISFWLAVGYLLALHSRSCTRRRRRVAILPSRTHE